MLIGNGIAEWRAREREEERGVQREGMEGARRAETSRQDRESLLCGLEYRVVLT